MESKGGEATLQTWIEYHGLTSLTLEHAARLEVLMLTTEKQAYANGFDAGYSAGQADAQRWIPCSERLPEEDKYVLLFDGEDYRVGMLTHETSGYEEGYQITQYWIDVDENWTPDLDEVTLWQPLPPPQEQPK